MSAMFRMVEKASAIIAMSLNLQDVGGVNGC
jgi:hypothetical protein